MKLLTLMRHAKSSRDDPTLEDFDRPLAELGRRQAPAIAAFMKERGLAPDYILTSSARRTRETFELLAPAFPGASVSLSKRLYNAPPDRILAEVRSAAYACGHVLVIAHNPGIKLLAQALADPARSDDESVRRIDAGFKSGALAHFELDIERWADAAEARAILRFYATPKEAMR